MCSITLAIMTRHFHWKRCQPCLTNKVRELATKAGIFRAATLMIKKERATPATDILSSCFWPLSVAAVAAPTLGLPQLLRDCLPRR